MFAKGNSFEACVVGSPLLVYELRRDKKPVFICSIMEPLKLQQQRQLQTPPKQGQDFPC